MILVKDNLIQKITIEKRVNEHNAFDRTQQEMNSLFKRAGLVEVCEVKKKGLAGDKKKIENNYWALRPK